MPSHQMDVTRDELRVQVLSRRYAIQHPTVHRADAPVTQERHLLQLLPPVPPRPLPAALSPRRAPLRLLAWRAAGRLQRLAYGSTTDRALVLLAAAVVGAAVAALIGLESRWPSDSLGVAR